MGSVTNESTQASLTLHKRKGDPRPRMSAPQPNGRPAETEAAHEGAGRSSRGGMMLFLMCFVGIFGSYFVYGLLQEKITKRKFGDERFRYFVFLVGIQCVINAAFAKSILWHRGLHHSLAPYRLFAVLAFTYVGAMVASNSSLAFISYPTQVLGKSAKPIPVMVFGVLLSHRRYSLGKYIAVLLIVTGIAMFFYKDGGGSAYSNGDQQWRLFHFIGVGELLVILSLTFDGLTGAAQERLRSKFDVQALHMMFAVNVYSAAYLSIGVLVTGEVVEVGGFIYRHPVILGNILAFGIASAVGQYFIFTTITNFGPLTCSIFTTTRKFFTILGSVLIFGNELLQRQWVGVVIAFLGLGLDIFIGKYKAQKKVAPPPQTNSV